MEKFRIIYNDQEVLSIDKNEGIAYTSDKVIIGDLKSCKDALDKLLVDTTKINEYEYSDPLNYKYFLIPIELIPQIKHYSEWVKMTYPDLVFDVTLTKDEVVVEGTTFNIPSSTLKMIPCSVTRWVDEGVQLLDAIVENWNYSVPSKQINFDVKFESYSELMEFIKSN